jgi:hypothetical protein
VSYNLQLNLQPLPLRHDLQLLLQTAFQLEGLCLQHTGARVRWRPLLCCQLHSMGSPADTPCALLCSLAVGPPPPPPTPGLTSGGIEAVLWILAERAHAINQAHKQQQQQQQQQQETHQHHQQQQQQLPHLRCLKLGPPAECQEQHHQQQQQAGGASGWPGATFDKLMDWYSNHVLLQQLSVLELWGLSDAQQAEVRVSRDPGGRPHTPSMQALWHLLPRHPLTRSRAAPAVAAAPAAAAATAAAAAAHAAACRGLGGAWRSWPASPLRLQVGCSHSSARLPPPLPAATGKPAAP